MNVTGWALLVCALVAAATPWVRRGLRRLHRLRLRVAPGHHAVGRWSDADLVHAWRRSDDELLACAGRPAARTLTVVMWRATLLDELDRRELTPPVAPQRRR